MQYTSAYTSGAAYIGVHKGCGTHMRCDTAALAQPTQQNPPGPTQLHHRNLPNADAGVDRDDRPEEDERVEGARPGPRAHLLAAALGLELRLQRRHGVRERARRGRVRAAEACRGLRQLRLRARFGASLL